MKKAEFYSSSGPEEVILQGIIQFLTVRGWHVMRTHGNMYQSGFPDLFACHHKYGSRWIEVKNPEKYAFTPAQIDQFPLMCAHGSAIWILTAASEEEYEKLFKPFNWHHFLHIFRGS